MIAFILISVLFSFKCETIEGLLRVGGVAQLKGEKIQFALRVTGVLTLIPHPL